jgi:hypothetical protein
MIRTSCRIVVLTWSIVRQLGTKGYREPLNKSSTAGIAHRTVDFTVSRSTIHQGAPLLIAAIPGAAGVLIARYVRSGEVRTGSVAG